jgi:hypothetical protein
MEKGIYKPTKVEVRTIEGPGGMNKRYSCDVYYNFIIGEKSGTAKFTLDNLPNPYGKNKIVKRVNRELASRGIESKIDSKKIEFL